MTAKIMIVDPTGWNLAVSSMAKNDVRYALNGIVMFTDGSVGATNGHVASVANNVVVYENLIETIIDYELIGEHGGAKAGVIVSPQKVLPKKCVYAVIDIDRKMIIPYDQESKPLTPILFEWIDAVFPDLTTYFNEREEPREQITFSPGLLTRLVSNLDKEEGAHFEFYGPDHFFRMKYKNIDAQSIVMPMRGQ